MAPRKRLARSPAEFAEILSDPTAVGLLPDTPTEPVAYTPPAPPPAATPAAEEGSALLHGLGTIISLPGKAMEVVDAPFKALSRETYRRLFPEVSEEAIPSPGQMLAAAATGGGPPETLGEGVVRGGAEFAGDILTSPSTMALFSRALAGKIPSVAHKVLTAGLVGGIAEGIKNTYEKASEEGGLTPGVAETAMRPILDTALLVPGALRERMARGAAAPGLEAGPAAPPPQIEPPPIRGFLGPGEGGDVAGTPGPPEPPLRPFGGPGGAVGPIPPTEPPQVTKAKGVIRTVRDMVETGQATGAVDAVEKLGKATTLLQGVGPVGAEPEPVRERALAAAQAAVDAVEAKIDRLWGIPAITPEEFATRQAGLQQLFSQREAARNDLARLQQAQTADEWRALMEARRNAPPMPPEAPGGGAPPVAAPGMSPAGPGAPPRAPVATMERPMPAAPAETPGADVRENAPARTQALLAQARDVTTGGTGEVLPPEAGVVGAAGPPRAAAGIPPGVSGPPPPTAGGFAPPPAASPVVTPPQVPPPVAQPPVAQRPPVASRRGNEEAPTVGQIVDITGLSRTGPPGMAIEDSKIGRAVVLRDSAGKAAAVFHISTPVKDYPMVGEIAVDPSLQRQGIGTQLVDMARQAGLPVDEALNSGENIYSDAGAAFVRQMNERIRPTRPLEGEQAPIPGSEPTVAPRYERTPEGEQALIPGSEVARGPMADVRGQGPLFDEAARDAEAETQATAALKEREAAARLERERRNAAAQTTLTIPPAEPATPRPAAEAEPTVAPEPAATEEAGPPRATGGGEDVDLTEEQTAALGRWLGTRKVDPQGPQAAEITRAARLVRGAVQQHQRAAAERDAAYALKPTIKVRLSDQAGKKYHQSIRPVDVKRAREQAKDALEIARGVYQGAVDTLRASVRDVPGASFRSLLQIAENRMAARGGTGGPGVLLKATGAEIAAMTEQLQHSPILFHTLTERAVAYTPEAAVSDDAVLRRMESIAKRGDELAALGGKPNWKAMAAAELAGVGERAVQDALHQGTRHPAFGKILEYQKREARERRALYEAAAEDGWGDGAEQDTYDAEAIRRHLATYRDGLAAELERIPEDEDPTLPWGVIDPATGVAVTARAALDALETKAGRLYARIVYAVSDSLVGTAEEGDDVPFDVPEGLEGEDLGPLEANEPPRFQGSLFSMPLGPASLREAKKAVDAREHRGYTRPDAAPRRGPEDDRGARAGVPGPVRPAGGPESRLGGGTPVGRGEGGVHAAPGSVVRGVQEGARQPVFAIRTIRPTLTAVRPADPGLIPERLRPHLDENQQEGAARAIRAMGEAERGFMLADGTGVGKAQPLDANVLTPTGWRLLGDLRIGDEVISVDGTSTYVTGVFPQGKREACRVQFSDGASTECCDEHLWKTWTAYDRAHPDAALCPGTVKPLFEIERSIQASQGKLNHTVPIVGPVQFRPVQLPLDPYVLGALLGDGCMRKSSVTLTVADEHIVSAVSARLPHGTTLRQVAGGISWGVSSGSGKGLPRANRNPVLLALREMGLAGLTSERKFVPPAYLLASAEQRLEMLRGLMDTDGTVNQAGTHTSFTTTSRQLADDVVFLVRSLGGLAQIHAVTKRYQYNGRKLYGKPAWAIGLSMPPEMNPFGLPRKAQRVRPKTKYPPTRFIAAIERTGIHKEMRCISVAHESRLYVTDDFIVTHNTREILATAAHFADKGHPVLIFAPAGVINVPDSGPDKGKVTGSYADDSAAMGVPVELLRFPMKVKAGPELQPGKVYLSAYELIGKQRVTKDTVVIFDEAHYIKNADKSARGEAGMAHARTAHAVLFSTATPGDQAHHLMYAKRIGLLEGKSEREALADLGMELATTTGKDGTARSFWKPKSIELMKKRVRELYGRLTEQGRMIKREVDFAPVEVDFRTAIPVSEERAAELKKIADTWPGEDAISKRMKLMHQRRQLEPDKLPHVQRIIEEELAAGRQVVVFAQRLRQSDVYKREYAMVNGERVLVSEEYITGSEGTLGTLGKWLDEKGIPYATIHGETEGPKSEQIRRFQAGEAKVVIATVEAGGTGVSLDDRRGDAPRTLVMMTAPLESTSYLQAMGRVHRKPTMSTSRVIGLFSDHEADLWNQGIIVRKLELANAQVAGSVRRLNPELEGQVDVDSGETDLDLVSPQAGKPSKKQAQARIASGQVARTLDALVTWQGRTENPKRVHSEKQYRFHRRAIETMGGALDASGDWQIPTTDGMVVRGILTHPREGGITGLFRYGPPERPADLGHLEANDHAVSVRAQLEALAAVSDATRPLPAPHALAVGVGLNYDKDPNWDIVSTTLRKSFASNWSVRWKDFRNVQITSVHDLAAIAQIARNTSLEQAHFLLMKKGRIVTAVLSGAGLPGQTRILPDGFTVDDLKETMRTVGADGYYLVHNHPDGLPTPSQTDIASTKKVADLIPGFLGHVIVDHGTYGTIEKADIDSMEPGAAGERKLYEKLSRVKSRSAAWLTEPDPFLAEGVDPVAYWQTSEYDLRTQDQLLRAYARNLVRHAEEHPTWPLVILADSRRRFRAALSVSPSVYYDPEKFSAWLAQRNVEFGAVVAHVAVVGARRDAATLQYLRSEMVDLALDPVAAQRMAILGAKDRDIWNGAVTTPPADFGGFGANEPPPFEAGEDGPPEEPGGGGAGGEPPRDPPWGTGPGPDDEGWNRRATFAEARARAGGPWTGRRLRDALIAGVDRFKRGLRDFGRWAASMDFGGIGPFLKRIWGRITDWFQPQMTTTTVRGEGAGPYDAARAAGRRGPARPIPRVSPEDVDAAARRMGQPPPEPRPGQERPPRSPLNLDRIVDEADIKAILRSIQESLGGKFKKAQGYRSWAEARQKALEAGLTEQDVMRLLREKGVLTDVEIDAIRLLRQEAGIDVSHKLAYLTDLRARLADAADPARRAALEQEALEAERDYRAALQRLIAISLTTKAAGAEAGRALAMHRRMMESLSPEERAMRRILRGLDPSERDTADLAEALRSGNMADLMRVVNRLRKPSLWGMFNEYFLNSILSGPSTLIANVAGNVSHEVLLRTPERGLAALFEEAGITQAIESLFGRGHGRAPERLSGEMREAGRALWKARLSFPEMLTFMKDALWNERTPTGVHGEWTPPSIPGVLGKVVRTPGRLMEALDQASKGSAARAERAAQLFRMAANEMKAGGESWSKERMRSRIDELDADLWKWQELDLARRINPRDLSREDAVFLARNRRFSAVVQAMEHAANVSTFRDAVHPLTRMLMTARARYPWLVPLVPFVRTPERILASALKRTPLGLVDALRKMQSGKLEGGAAADRLAQGVFGTAITLGLFAAAKAGYITGSGPVDPDERRNWLKTGKVPYAVKVGNTWVSMARIEPLATSLGFASDLAEAGDAKSAKDAFDKLHYAALNNVFNKTYLEGLINASQAMSDPDRYAAEFSKRLVGALVPNLLASAARAIDPTIRQTDDISSTLMARVPLLSEQLQPRLTGTGEEVKRPENAVSRFVSPIRYSTEAGPEADLERVFLELGYNPTAPPRTARLPKSGRDYYLSPEERGYYADAAARATAFARGLVERPEWKDLNDYQKEEVLKRIYRFAHDVSRRKVYNSLYGRIWGGTATEKAK